MTPLTKFSIDIFSDIKIDNHVTIVLIFSREISKGVYFMIGIYNEIWKKWIDKEFVKKEVEQLFKNAPLEGNQIVENLMINKKVGNYELTIIFDTLIRTSSPKKKDEYMINSESIIILIK